ncbi:MAG TPA: hypothetical protein DCS97_07165 [Planctomycetes bacterium]|nr:hypothetical protein [Planctomycetota bacterium]
MVKPDRSAAFVRTLVSEARKQGVSAYRLKQDGVLSLSQAQRFLAGDLNPTASTCEAIAKALGVVIEVRQQQ